MLPVGVLGIDGPYLLKVVSSSVEESLGWQPSELWAGQGLGPLPMRVIRLSRPKDSWLNVLFGNNGNVTWKTEIWRQSRNQILSSSYLPCSPSSHLGCTLESNLGTLTSTDTWGGRDTDLIGLSAASEMGFWTLPRNSMCNQHWKTLP